MTQYAYNVVLRGTWQMTWIKLLTQLRINQRSSNWGQVRLMTYFFHYWWEYPNGEIDQQNFPVTDDCNFATWAWQTWYLGMLAFVAYHDDVIKWKHFLRYWPFVRGNHRSPVNSPHKGQWRVALMFTLICARINGWVNNRDVGDLRLYRAHYDVIVMCFPEILIWRLVCQKQVSRAQTSNEYVWKSSFISMMRFK